MALRKAKKMRVYHRFSSEISATLLDIPRERRVFFPDGVIIIRKIFRGNFGC